MMKMKTKATVPAAATNDRATFNGGGEPVGREWELRPGGMLVQKRNPDSDSERISIPPPTIRVRVKYGSIYHQININSQATFGELKKMLTALTGLHHQDQKLLYKDKERDSKSFLDMSGVKDKSKIVLIEDTISQEKRLLEMRKNAKMEKAAKSISEISLEVDRLAGQASSLESIISKGGKVVEKDVLNLIELLMNQLLKLDGIMADGDVKLQRKMQVRRVQKCVETLDVLKIKNSMSSSNRGGQMEMQTRHLHTNSQKLSPIQEQPSRDSVAHLPIHKQQQPRHSASDSVAVTTKWETFGASSASLSVPSTSATRPNNSVQPKIPWEFFD